MSTQLHVHLFFIRNNQEHREVFRDSQAARRRAAQLIACGASEIRTKMVGFRSQITPENRRN